MPALIESEHPACAALIREYKACSAEASLLSKVLFSTCTALKYRLDECFRQEKIARTKRNIAHGKVRPSHCALQSADQHLTQQTAQWTVRFACRHMALEAASPCRTQARVT